MECCWVNKLVAITLPGGADLCHELKMILHVDDQQGASREAFAIQKLDGHYWFLDSDFADSVFFLPLLPRYIDGIV